MRGAANSHSVRIAPASFVARLYTTPMAASGNAIARSAPAVNVG